MTRTAVAADGSFAIEARVGRGYGIRIVREDGASDLVFPRANGSLGSTFEVDANGVAFDVGVVRHLGDPRRRSYAFSGAVNSGDPSVCEGGGANGGDNGGNDSPAGGNGTLPPSPGNASNDPPVNDDPGEDNGSVPPDSNDDPAAGNGSAPPDSNQDGTTGSDPAAGHGSNQDGTAGSSSPAPVVPPDSNEDGTAGSTDPGAGNGDSNEDGTIIGIGEPPAGEDGNLPPDGSYACLDGVVVVCADGVAADTNTICVDDTVSNDAPSDECTAGASPNDAAVAERNLPPDSSCGS